MAKRKSAPRGASRPTRSDITDTFNFAEYLFLLERTLPKRSKALKLVGKLEAYVESLRAKARPWDARDYKVGDVRSAAQRELLDIFLAIPEQWNNAADGIVMTAFGCYMSFRSAPPEVRAEGLELLKRERYVPYVDTFLTLRDKGHVVLTKKSRPAKGGHAERFGS